MQLFSAMVKAMKCTWVQIILQRESSRNTLFKYIVKYRGYETETFLKCKLYTTHLMIHFVFYKQVLEYWYCIFSREPVSAEDVVSSYLWHNKYICIAKKPAKYNTWIEKGILLMEHILDNKGHLYSKTQLETKYDFVIKQMDYNSLIDAIPNIWKRKVRDRSCSIDKNYCDKMYINSIKRYIITLKCKDFYWEFVSMTSELPKC